MPKRDALWIVGRVREFNSLFYIMLKRDSNITVVLLIN
jgi:hypothetical protein